MFQFSALFLCAVVFTAGNSSARLSVRTAASYASIERTRSIFSEEAPTRNFKARRGRTSEDGMQSLYKDAMANLTCRPHNGYTVYPFIVTGQGCTLSALHAGAVAVGRSWECRASLS